MAEKNTFLFGFNFQIDLIKLMLENINFFLACRKFVLPEFFSTERLEYFVRKLYEYFDKYQKIPNRVFFESLIKEGKDKIIVKVLFKERAIQKDFIIDSTEDFIKRSLFIDYHVESANLYNKNQKNPSLAYEYMVNGMEQINKVSLHTDNFDFLFKDFEKRIIEREHKINTQQIFKVKTGIYQIDRILRGGATGGEVNMLLGDAKSGKSIGLIYLGTQAVKRFVPVLHFQLEGRREETLDRYDAAFLGATLEDVFKNQIPKQLIEKMKRISDRRKYKDLLIRHYNDWDTCSILDIEREYLDVVSRGYDVKVIIIDYMDLMRSRKDYKEERHRQQSIIRDIKTFATKYNVVVWTATQASRGKKEEENDPNFILTSKNISEDYGKVRAIDTLITINSTPSEMEKGLARLFVDMARNNPAKKLIRIRRAMDRGVFYLPPGVYFEGNEKVFSERVVTAVKKEQKEIYNKKKKGVKKINVL